MHSLNHIRFLLVTVERYGLYLLDVYLPPLQVLLVVVVVPSVCTLPSVHLLLSPQVFLVFLHILLEFFKLFVKLGL